MEGAGAASGTVGGLHFATGARGDFILSPARRGTSAGSFDGGEPSGLRACISKPKSIDSIGSLYDFTKVVFRFLKLYLCPEQGEGTQGEERAHGDKNTIFSWSWVGLDWEGNWLGFIRRVAGPPPPMFLLPFRTPLLKILVKVHGEGAEEAWHMGVRSPLTPTLSPLEKGGEGVGSGGM
jgi:hypothetical protein